MLSNLKEIESSALKLDRKEKARLTDKLLQSMHGEIDPHIEQAWIEEVQKRKESLRSGKASLHPASEVINEARKRIQK